MLIQAGVVVGAVVDADAAAGDGVEAHGQQFQVVGAGQRQRHVPGRAQQRAPHLVRGQRLLRQDRVAQPVVGAVLPARGDPLVQQLLQLGHGEACFVLHRPAALQDVGAGVAGDVLCEQRVDTSERPLDGALGGRGTRRGGLHAHPEGFAGGQERGGDEDPAAVDDDRLGHHHRACRRLLKPRVQGQQPGVGDGGVGQAQLAGPAGPCGVGHGHLGEQQGRVHGPRALLAQHGRHHRPRGHIQGDGQLRAYRAAVLADSHHVQAGGVDLDQLARPQRHRRPEGPRRRSGGGAGRAAGMLQRVGQYPRQPVERRRRRQRHRARPVGVGQDLSGQLPKPLQRAPGAAALAAQRLQHGGHHPLIGPARRAGRFAAGDQSHEAARVVAGAHAAHGGAADPRPAQRREFVGLGLLPLGHRPPFRVVFGPGYPAAARAAGQPGLDLADVPLPGQSPLPLTVGHRLQQPPRRYPGGRGVDYRERGVGEQERGEHRGGLPVLVDQPHRRPGHGGHLPGAALERHIRTQLHLPDCGGGHGPCRTAGCAHHCSASAPASYTPNPLDFGVTWPRASSPRHRAPRHRRSRAQP